ncbi:hypothetical protein ACP3W1_23950, partial [Salmonella enterica]
VNGMDAGQSFHLVHVWDDTITHAVVPVVDAEPAGYFTPEWVARMAALTPDERLEAFSRKRGGGVHRGGEEPGDRPWRPATVLWTVVRLGGS